MKKFALLLMAVATTLILTACSHDYEFKIDKEGNLTGDCVYITMADDIRKLMAVEALDSLFIDPTYMDFDALFYKSDEYLVDAMIKDFSMGSEWCQEKTKINGELAVTNTGAFDTIAVRDALKDSGAYVWDSTKFVYTPTLDNTFVPFEREAIIGMEAADFSKILGRELGSHEKAWVCTLQQNFTVTLPDRIVYTNGELSNDGKTVTWAESKFTNDDKLFAYTADAEEVAGMVFEDTTDTEEAVEELVTLTNVKKGNVIYKKSTKVTALSKIKAIYVNGKKIKSKSKVTFAEDGEYTIKVKTADYTKTIVVTKKTKKTKKTK